jgi:hypothetical protein
MRDFNLQDGQVIGDVRTGGDSFVQSSAIPAIDGDLKSGGQPKQHDGIITGSVQEGLSPSPVTDICTPQQLASRILNSDQIQAFRDAANAFEEEVDFSDELLTLTGIVLVSDSLRLRGNVVLSGNVVFIVDGDVHFQGPGSLRSHPPGSTATIIVPEGNLYVQADGDVEIEGTLQVGTVDMDTDEVVGGSLHVQGGSRFSLKGSLLVASGSLHSQGNSTLGISHQKPVDPNLRIVEAEDSGQTFFITAWRQSQE